MKRALCVTASMNAGGAETFTPDFTYMGFRYIRLKNFQIGYNLPKKWISKLGLSKVSVYFSGENLWSWSPLYRHTTDYDVLTASKGSDTDLSGSNVNKGDAMNYPTMRILSFGISITY